MYMEKLDVSEKQKKVKFVIIENIDLPDFVLDQWRLTYKV
jgi:hypothetical protein